jgi:hypothetical protein
MSNLRVVPINFWDEATLSVTTGTILSTLPVTNTQLVARDAVARSSNNGDLVIEGHWNGEARKVDSFFMFRHNGHGGKVKLQLFQNADRTGELYNSGAVEIYQLQGLDVDWGWSPLGFGSNDLLGLEAPYSLFHTAAVAASFKLTFTRCTQAYWEFGRFFMGKYVEAPYNPEHGMSFGWQSNTQQKRSRGASLRTSRGERWREMRADMHYESDADRAIWRDLLGQIDTAEDVAVSIFPGAGGRPERDHVFNAQLQQHSPFTWANPVFNESVITFTEV